MSTERTGRMTGRSRIVDSTGNRRANRTIVGKKSLPEGPAKNKHYARKRYIVANATCLVHALAVPEQIGGAKELDKDADDGVAHKHEHDAQEEAHGALPLAFLKEELVGAHEPNDQRDADEEQDLSGRASNGRANAQASARRGDAHGREQAGRRFVRCPWPRSRRQRAARRPGM